MRRSTIKRLALVVVVVIGLAVILLGSGVRLGSFQEQGVIYFPGQSCLQHCAGIGWVWFSAEGMRWTDGNLHLITEGVYRGGYEVR